MKLAIFGATGFTGKVVLAEAMERGHEVVALARDPEKLTADARLTIVEGDALDPEAVERTIAGQDAVLQCLGIGGMGNGKPTTFVSSATAVIVAAMEKHDVKRLVCMSNVGVGDSAAHLSWLVRRIIKPVFYRKLRPIEDDKERMEPIIRESQLDWTIVRFPGVKDAPATGRVHVTYDGKGLGLFITNADGAGFLLDLAQSQEHVRGCPSISN